MRSFQPFLSVCLCEFQREVLIWVPVYTCTTALNEQLALFRGKTTLLAPSRQRLQPLHQKRKEKKRRKKKNLASKSNHHKSSA